MKRSRNPSMLHTARRAAELALTMLLIPVVCRGQGTTRTILPFQGAVAVKPGQAALDMQPYGARFRIYSAAQAGSLVYEDIQSITIANGTFSVALGGGVTPLDPNIAQANPDAWLEITIDTDRSGTYDAAETMAPRIHLGSAFSAMFATQAGFAASAQQANLATTAQRADALNLPATLQDGSGDDVATIRSDGGYVVEGDFGEGDPPRGSTYRDNTCIAWGVVSSGGNLVSGFGIESVNFDSDDGEYRVTLWNDVDIDGNDEEMSVCVTSLDNSQRGEVAIYRPIDGDEIGVTIRALDEAFVAGNQVIVPIVTSAFSIQVFGRPN